MSLLILLSAPVGAAIFFLGWLVGNKYRHKEEKSPERSGRKRKPRPPRCYVVAPGEPDEEPKKRRKKRSASEALGSAEFDEQHMKKTDIRI